MTYGLSTSELQHILASGLKPEEIASLDPTVRINRVRELVGWFSRLANQQANPKWAVQHAFELAYYVATTDLNSAVDLTAMRVTALMEGVNVSEGDRTLLQRFSTALPEDKLYPDTLSNLTALSAMTMALKRQDVVDVAPTPFDTQFLLDGCIAVAIRKESGEGKMSTTVPGYTYNYSRPPQQGDDLTIADRVTLYERLIEAEQCAVEQALRGQAFSVTTKRVVGGIDREASYNEYTIVWGTL